MTTLREENRIEFSAAEVVPVADADSEPFWSAARNGRFVTQLCEECGRRQYPPLPVCRHCRSSRLRWEEGPREGVLHSYVVVHHAVAPQFKDQVPFVIGLVELEPGLRVVVRLEAGDAAVRAGMPVRIDVSTDGPGVALVGVAPETPTQPSGSVRE